MSSSRRPARRWPVVALGLLALGWSPESAAWPGDEVMRDTDPRADTIVELHFNPVPNTQIAVWLTDENDSFLRDLFVTQATGKLGIGNRSGVWNFLSSWRAPYGPRRSVLPVWGHARGQTYPEIVFHDPNPSHSTSLGFHEATSSAEPYHCRPLLPNEHEAILDSMTCPSPATFRTDKGMFEPGGATSVYPPRGDIPGFNPDKDHVDTQMYAALNDLDAVTGATPSGSQPTFLSFRLDEQEQMAETLVAWIEVSLEGDENADWSFDRENDHFVDSLLSSYGVPWLGQPSVLYRVSFDPSTPGTYTTDAYVGYGSWDGSDGEINPPDGTISQSGGSGADRLRMMERFDLQFRAAVHTGEGGSCLQQTLPTVETVEVDPIAFDRVLVSFTLPETLPEGTTIRRFRVLQELDATLDSFDPDRAIEAIGVPAVCDEAPGVEQDEDCVFAQPGETIAFEVASLFGNYDYTFSVNYEDQCTNSGMPVLAETRTPNQEFQQIETFCFVATAAWGAHWGEEVFALRRFRDRYLKSSSLGLALVRSYYTYGPVAAALIKDAPLLRAAARASLARMAQVAELVSPIRAPR